MHWGLALQIVCVLSHQPPCLFKERVHSITDECLERVLFFGGLLCVHLCSLEMAMGHFPVPGSLG